LLLETLTGYTTYAPSTNYFWSEIMNAVKSFFALVLTSALLFASSANAGGYDITSFWSGGTTWVVAYNANLAQETPRFKIVHDKVAKVVTFSFTGMNNENLGSCFVGQNSLDEGRSLADVYLEAVEVSENSSRLSFMQVNSWQGQCFDISRVEYRTDLKVVEVVCDKGTTVWGQSVYIVGNTPRLGNWDPAKAVKLEPTFYPQWIANVVVENNTNVEWKCIKRSETNPTQNLVWMSGANRTFFSGTTNAVWASF